MVSRTPDFEGQPCFVCHTPIYGSWIRLGDRVAHNQCGSPKRVWEPHPCKRCGVPRRVRVYRRPLAPEEQPTFASYCGACALVRSAEVHEATARRLRQRAAEIIARRKKGMTNE